MNKINQVNFFGNNSKITNLNGGISVNSNDTNVKSFQDVVSDMINEMNEITNKPSQLASDAMVGKADIHDVMASVAQAELTVQTATTITGKILQTYEKIMQIQI